MTTKEIAAEAARLALLGAAAYVNPDDAQPDGDESPAAYVLRLVLLGATIDGENLV